MKRYRITEEYNTTLRKVWELEAESEEAATTIFGNGEEHLMTLVKEEEEPGEDMYNLVIEEITPDKQEQ